MREKYLALLVAAFAAISLVSDSKAGGGHHCAHCGCHAASQKVCRLVKEEKKVEIVCWGCKTEDFCLPGPSKPGCEHCEYVCDDCEEGTGPDAIQTKAKKFVWTEWIPGCSAKVHTKKKLMKKVVTKKVPSYKWVVEDLCPQCDANCVGATVEPGVEVPPPPVANAKLKYTAALPPIPE
jgi:hypothetical protein